MPTKTASEAGKPKKRCKPGRPKGAKTQDVPTVTHTLPQCPRCGSIARSRVLRTHPIVFGPTTNLCNGTTHTRLVKRRVRCGDCGQLRDEMTYEAHAEDEDALDFSDEF